MDSLADGQRALFDALYTYRIEVAVASLLSAAGLGVLAWRLGWFAAARRHPRRSLPAAAIALAVAIPLTYYLASPIWVRSELIEPDAVAEVGTGGVAAPVSSPFPAGASSTPSASASARSSMPPAVSSQAAVTSAPFASRSVAAGTFTGTDDFHFGRGTATIVETELGRYTLRLVDFSVRNGPDLYVYLSPSRDDYVDGALELGKLKATDGSFSYALPAGTDPGRFASALIWCKQFSHLFAVAPFKAG